MASGAVWATLSTVTIFLVFLFTRERPESMEERPTRDQMPYLQQLRTVFKNRPYLFVIALYLFSWLGLQILQVVLIYYTTYYMRIPADYYSIGGVTLPPMSAILLAVQGDVADLPLDLVWAGAPAGEAHGLHHGRHAVAQRAAFAFVHYAGHAVSGLAVGSHRRGRRCRGLSDPMVDDGRRH